MPYGMIHYNAPGDTFEEFIKYVADTGFDCVEVMIYDVWPRDTEFTEDLAHEAKAILDTHEVFASALTAANDFVQLEAAAIAEQVDRMQKVAQLAKILQTDILRTEGGQPKDEVPEDKWAEAIAGCLKACVPFCEDMGMKMAVDNHGVVSNDPKVLMAALSAVDHPLVGSNLDTMNFRWWGNAVEDLPQIYRDVAPYVKHTHMKDGTGVRREYVGAALGEGEIPLVGVVESLVEAGYDGVWCAEWEGKGDKGEGYAACLKWMKENCPG